MSKREQKDSGVNGYNLLELLVLPAAQVVMHSLKIRSSMS